MVRIFRLHGLAALTLVGVAAPVIAQGSSGSDSLRGRLDPEREMERPVLPDAETQLPDGIVAVTPAEGSGVPIRHIRFLGTDVPSIVADSAQPFVGAPLTRDTLKQLVEAMSAAYARSDVALFTVVVPEQDFANGDVRVLVAEGHIDEIVLSGDLTPLERAFIEAATEDLKRVKPTDRGDLGRSLLILNDVPGLKVNSSIRKSREAEAVTLLLDARQKRFDASVGYDSRTTQLIDQGQFSGKLAGFGLLRAGDSTRIDAAASTNFRDFRYIGIAHETPLGADGTRAGIGLARLESIVEDTGVSGEATLYSANLSHPFIRGPKQNLNGTLIVDALDSNNAAFGSLVATEQTRAVRAAIRYDRSWTDMHVALSTKVSQGLDVWNAQTSQPVDQLEFLKAEASAKLVRRFARQYFLRANATGQWSDDPLPANERFSVGGPNYGRAFETGLINADKGAGASLEVAYRPMKKGKFAASEVYTFADYAIVDFVDRPIDDADLGSAGLGVRANYDNKFELGLEASRAYDLPVPDYQDNWQFAINWRIRFDPYGD